MAWAGVFRARVAFIGLCFEGFVFAKDVLLLKLLGLVCRLVLVRLYFDIWMIVAWHLV